MKILVEGNTDKKFVIDYLSHIGLRLKSDDLIVIQGYSSLPKFKNEIQREHDLGGNTVVVLDADDNPGEKREMVAQVEGELSVPVPAFLFPNDRDGGTLEDLLSSVVNPAHCVVLKCFDGYQDCLCADDNYSYTLPGKKAKIYAYCEAVLPANEKEKFKEEKRDYLNKELWDLESHHLKSFREFLLKHVAF